MIRKSVQIIDELKLGGAQIYLYRLLKEFKRNHPNYPQRVICLFHQGEFVEKIRSLGIEVECLHLEEQLKLGNHRGALNSIIRSLQADKPHIVQTHLSFSRIYGIPAAFYSRIPIRISIEHGDIFNISKKWKWANYVIQFLTSRIIAVSSAISLWLQKTYSINKGKIQILHNSLDLDDFKTSTSSLARARLGITDNAFIFCTVGTLGTGVNKRVDISISAVKQAQIKSDIPIHLLICGDGPLKEELKQHARALKIENQIHFLGKRDDVADILNASDAFCHAAPFEPFGLVCLEAMWMGCPVIVPNSGGIQEIVTDGQTGYIYQSLNEEDLAHTMLLVAKYPKPAKKIAENARKLVEEKYSMSSYGNQLIQIYRALN